MHYGICDMPKLFLYLQITSLFNIRINKLVLNID